MSSLKLRLLILLAFALFMVEACGSASSTGASTPTPESLVPFTTFLQRVPHARYSDYSGLPTTKVQNEQEFEAMRSYILKIYNGKRADSSYLMNGQTFDCIISNSKPGNPPTPSTEGTSTSTVGQPNTSATTPCKNGTIPMQRITLEKMVQFPTLQAFLAKSPGGPSLPPVPSPTEKNNSL
jgi:hypothetical protein